MSVRTVLSQKSRPYKIEVYGLQDDFIGTLQSFNDSFIGQIVSPEIKFSDDGTQTFTCSIPKFYIDPETNLKIENPRWTDINNGVLAENTRVLKIFLDYGNEIKVYPFIVDKITDKRDSHFSVYREVEASGMAFAELGKTGYKLELNSHTIESIQEEDIEILPYIDFWLDYVFPNEKDEDGKVIKWLTPWCYEIRMDWSHYAVEGRLSNKIYEDSYVTSWGVRDALTDEYGNITTAAGLEAQGVESGAEKARYIDCTNSNKYNITQDISEAFEVFCQYEYKCDSRGKFIHEYVDENGNVWTGRKAVFYNRAIKTDNPIVIDYKKNLSTITRTCDSSEIYTKLYVTPIESSTMETGYISIADTPINPTLDEFILNFDYLYNIGSISQYQLNYVKTYEVEIHKLNTELINLAPQIEDLTVRINNLKATKTNAENEKTSAEQTLQQYQTLRDSEVTNTPIRKNKDNPMSIIFVEDGDIKKAALRQIGIAPATIVGYSNFSYSKRIFDYNDIITVNQLGSTTANDTSYYLVLDEFGYPTYIYTSKNNSDFEVDNSSIIYLELEYSPKNAYVDICNQLEQRIIGKAATAETLEVSINDLQTQLDELELEQKKLLDNKEILNQKLELTLGPALREGYWTPDSYEDPGQARKAELVMVPTAAQTGAVLTFDNTAFEGEELNYYYANIDDVANDNKTYYPYIDISSIYEDWSDKNIENLTLHFLNPECKYTVGNNKIAAGNYFVIYNGLTKYYFNIPNDLTEGTIVEILINDSSKPYIKIGNTTISTNETELGGATNLTSIFEGIGNYLGERLVYNNAGFVFGFLKENNTITPVLLLNNLDISYSRYKKVQYSFNGDNRGVIANNLRIDTPPANAIFCYPRIIIYDSNVNYDSDNLKIIPYTGTLTEETQKLEKFSDYTILVRGGKPHFTLKITENNNLNKILSYSYHIEYQISRANEMLYLDAKNVARENSYPKYSYELSVANTPDNVGFYELGQLVFINDYLIGVSAATGYISGITYKLSNPQDDEIEIKNYKTKFEDLFSTITASSEAMRNNQVAYNIAAGSFNADGTIEGSVLQNSILNNNIAMNYSNTNVAIDDVNGIILTNQQPYLNGVYGQVKLMGGGIFLSNAIDGAGARIWNTGITPNGINAAMITAGQLDVNKIRVFAGDNIAFQWNSEGIFAYKQNEETGSVDLNTYVRYSDRGLQFVSGEHTAVDLGWNGLLISTQDGATQLTGKYGLTIYDGEPRNDEETGLPLNPVVRIGKFEEEDQSIDYGMRLYKQDPETDEYHETLITSNKGQLWLKDYIIVGIEETDDAGNINIAGASGVTNGLEGTILDGGDANEDPTIDNVVVYGGDFAGISGEVEATAGKSVRFWAGDTFNNRASAPFRVLQDGTLFATKAFIRGDIYAESGFFNGTIEAISGKIGGWTISKDVNEETNEVINYLMSEDGQTKLFGDGDIRIQIGENFSVDTDGVIKASAGQIGQLTIGDIDAMGGDITVNTAVLSVEGLTVVKIGENVNADFLVQCYRGNIPFKDIEYRQHYQNIIWEYAFDDTDEWFEIGREGINTSPIRTFNYSEVLQSSILIRCIFEGEEETIISNEILLTAITESDANAVIFSIVTPEGNIVNDVSKEVVLKAVLVDNGTTITNNITYLWEKYDIETKKYITLTEETNDTLTVKASDIISYGSYRCQAEYNNGTYLAYGSVQDGTDPLQCFLYSTIGNQILNGQGVGAIYARSYRGNVEVDPIKTTSFVTQLPSNFNEKNIYLLDNVNKQYVLYENNGSSWYPIEDNSVIIYTYSFRDKYGNNATYKGMTTYTGRVLYIDSELIDEKIIIDVTAEEAAI